MAKFVNKWLILLVCMCFFMPVLAQKKKRKQVVPDSIAVIVDTIPHFVRLYDSACRFIDSARFTDAFPLLKKVIKENPDYYMAHNKFAFIYIKETKYKEAFKSLDKAEKIRPMNFETCKLRGIAYFLTDQFGQSKVSLDSAVSMATQEKIDDAELLYWQAMLMFVGKNYKGAIKVCVAALDLNPKFLEVMVLKADCRYALKDYVNSVKDYDEAIKAMPADKPDDECFNARAKSRIEIGDYKGAIKDYSKIIEANPNDEPALVARAICKINLKDYSSAINDLDVAIKENSNNPVSWCNRGVAKSALKSYVAALVDINQAIKLKFDYAAAFVNRAAIKMASKDKHGACEDLEKADRIGDPLATKLIEQYCKGGN